MEMFPTKLIRKIPTPLLAWYDINKRQMAWRDHPSPYRTWVSEIMLQQTRVEAVHGYYARFMESLPTLADLAAADDELLYKLWEGLGYYSRVRNLKKAAKIVMEDFGGFLPNDPKVLQTLPGIGAYTAGAICSIAFGLPVAAVDGNVVRVFARLCDVRKDFSDDKGKRALATAIEPIMPTDKCSDFTQALMELGALICIPGAPRCDKCPLRSICRGFAAGTAASLPVLPAKKEKEICPMTVCALWDEAGNVYLRKRPDNGMLAGLWEPWHTDGHLSEIEVNEELKKQKIWVRDIRKTTRYTHIFTHKKWVMHGYRATLLSPPDGFIKVTHTEKDTAFALPKAFQVFVRNDKDET